jgi:hypothetical protein
MNRIHAFGDSYTEGQPMDCTFPPFVKWKELRGGTLPKCWVELLGEKLGMETFNYAQGGNSNYHTFEEVCKHSQKFNEGDIVIVNWTYKTRFRWASFELHSNGSPKWFDKYGEPSDYWRRMATNEYVEDYEFIAKETKNEILNNRISKLYSDELYGYENLLEQYAKSKGFDIFFWSTDNEIIYNLPLDEFRVKKYLLNDTLDIGTYHNIHMGGDLLSHIIKMGGKTIESETNGIVNDPVHLGESGHIIQSELFYDYIKSHKTNSH